MLAETIDVKVGRIPKILVEMKNVEVPNHKSIDATDRCKC